MGDAPLAELAQRLGLDRVPRMQLDPGDDLLAVLAVRHADHLHIGHRRVGEQELLDLARIHVLAAADDHVLVAPDDLHVALVVHGRQVAGVHPARAVDGLAGRFRVVPVAEHHAVAAGAQLADLPARHDMAVLVDDLALQVRLGTTDAGDAPFEVVARAGLGRHRAGLGHAVGDLHLAHVHLGDHPLHHLDRAGGAGHDAGAQAGQVHAGALGVVEHGDEHGRHAVQRGGALLGHRLQGGQRLEGGARVDHRAAVGQAAEVAHHHAEAVVQRHRDDQAVVLGEAEALADHVAVVEDVVVAEGGALGEAGGAGGVLDVDRLVELQLLAALAQLLGADLLGHRLQLLPAEHAVGRLPAEADHPAQLRQHVAVQGAERAAGQFRQQLAEHAVVVGGLEGIGADQPATAGLLERVLEFVEAVGGVDVDQDHPGLGAGELGDAPLGAVRRPDAQTLARLQADGDEGPRTAVDRLGQLGPGEAQALLAYHQRLALGETGHRLIEGCTDGHGQQRFLLRSAGVARKIHGMPQSYVCYEVCCF